MVDIGSQWHRWEPHIHAPGTVLNNQFGGPDPWGDYLSALEGLTPKIEAVAVTDYYVTDTYEKVCAYKAGGRLPGVSLVFPNVELRLDVAAKSGFVNIHLLVSPEDPDHLVQLQRFLSNIRFSAFDDQFACSRGELMALGRRSDPNIKDDNAALRQGATQFKVGFSQLRDLYQGTDWAKRNILVAVAGGEGDGTSGLRLAADATVRQEIEKFAHIIFSSNVAQREFWLGQRTVSEADLEHRYSGKKLCLHGSDSHSVPTVGRPVDDRYSWVKGGLEFDSLRQAYIDPEHRAFVGPNPPPGAMASQVIENVRVKNAPWLTTSDLPLNPGLVAIIGARGSGKTALADMIAAGCDSISEESRSVEPSANPSFLVRARPVIGDADVTLTWGGGNVVTRSLAGNDDFDPSLFPRARYLSQQFVEELCSSNGMSDGLVDEIERVIFEAYPTEDREDAANFSELREIKTSRFRFSREREAEAIGDLSERIALEFEKESAIVSLEAQVNQKKALIQDYTRDLGRLVVKGTEEHSRRHAELNEATQSVRSKIQSFSNRKRAFEAMQDEVANTRHAKAPELLRQIQERHSKSGLSEEQWNAFLLIFKGDVDKNLKDYIAWAESKINALTGPTVVIADPNVPLVAPNADLETQTLSLLTAELSRLEALIGADKVVRDKYTALSKRITLEKVGLSALTTKLEDANGAAERRKELQSEREAAYCRLINAVVKEQETLTELYSPLLARLQQSKGTLGKLGFYVRRVVDVGRWAGYAEEELLDRRKAGPFNGKGSLTALAEKTLRQVWETGSGADVRTAMTDFIQKYQRDLLVHAPYLPSQPNEYREWLKNFAHWLFGCDHISIRYELVYDGVDIRKLSPGTRGIVLLLMYLALDNGDDRPLIIDQPEENLDPKSVNDELVPLFVAARSKRQVIMVTHNANLVVNTNADQVIIADSGLHPRGGLPPITYRAGGLDSPEIRRLVCEILEGGEAAFKARAKRLRVKLER